MIGAPVLSAAETGAVVLAPRFSCRPRLRARPGAVHLVECHA